MDKKYKYGFYFLILALIIVGIIRIKIDFYNSLSFLTQAVIIYVILELLEEGIYHNKIL